MGRSHQLQVANDSLKRYRFFPKVIIAPALLGAVKAIVRWIPPGPKNVICPSIWMFPKIAEVSPFLRPVAFHIRQI